MDKILEIQLLAIRYAIKISIDVYAIYNSFESVSDQDILDSLHENEKDSYIGIGSDIGWALAIERDI